MANTDQRIWLQKLQAFINALLTPIIKTQDERNQYIDSKAMKTWTTAFTHETFSPSDNNEDLEFQGDAILKAAFPKYLRARFPYLHKNYFTELNVFYMSKVEQGKLAIKMGLGDYLRVKGLDQVIFNLQTDLFEAFFGALDVVSDSIVQGLGFANCYNMIIHLFSTIDIDEANGKGSAKTQVQQIFKRFDLGNVKEITEEYGTTVTFSVKLTDEQMDFLATYTVIIENPIIASYTAYTKKEADVEAYKIALETLANYGINTDWAEDAKKVRDFSDEVMAPYMPSFTQRLKSEGFVDKAFIIPRKTLTKQGAVVQLVGIRDNGQKELIGYNYDRTGEPGYITTKRNLVKQYAK